MPAGTHVYLYAVTRPHPGLEGVLARLPGIRGAPLRLIGSQSGDEGPQLAAVVSDVPAEEYRTDAGGPASRLDDLGWLSRTAGPHQAVNDALAGRTAVLPVRLGSAYPDDAGVRAMLDRDGARLDRQLGVLGGHQEWSVEIYTAQPAPPAREMESGTPPQPAAGRMHLSERRREQQHHKRAAGEARRLAQDIEALAQEIAVGMREVRREGHELSRTPGESIFNRAYLVPEGDSVDFERRVREAARGRAGVRLVVTGPRAPNSFTELGPVKRYRSGPAIH